ncbi:MAG: hypothetical protein ACK56F_04310, partial [bacterium]
RWIGQNIFDFFNKKFITLTHEYYKDAITSCIFQKTKKPLMIPKMLFQISKTPKVLTHFPYSKIFLLSLRKIKINS